MTVALPRISWPKNLAAAAGKIADDAAHIILGRHHFDLHDRLKQLRTGLLRSLAERGARSDFECERARVHLVICAVYERNLEVEHREAREHAIVQHALHALFDAGDIFLRN